MNCFDWQNRASDYLDGTLTGPIKEEADEHLTSCAECSERHKHYQIILTSIDSQARSTLPVPIRKAPFSAGIPKFDFAHLSRSRWEQIPWYLRTSIEGVGIVLVILLGISTGPKLRAVYERSMESNLSEFAQAFRNWRDPLASPDSSGVDSLPIGRSQHTAVDRSPSDGGSQTSNGFTSGNTDATEQSHDQATAGSDAGDDATPVEGGGGSDDTTVVHALAGQVWRFMIRTDSPREMRQKVIQVLTKLQIPSNTPGFSGVEAPGGIEFELLLPPKIVPDIKRELQAITPKAPAELAKAPNGESFTWYEKRSLTPLPKYKDMVVIWISQL